MRVGTLTQTIERGNTGDESKFRIRANSRAFSILSSNLYRYKIRAVIRELSCNAYDSHISAGCGDKPFIVHLPSTWEPWFSVQDFGTGLDHEQIMDIYTTYFASSKTDSNDYIGGLGLGSKSPFAYTDMYDVVSTKNGITNTYCMFKDENGEPSVTHMGTVESNLPNGVTVKVPVKTFDFYNFEQEAHRVFSWFKSKPTIVNNSYFKHRTYNAIMEGDNWRIIADYNGTSYALMGNVAYPISRDQVDKRFYEMLYYGLVIDFNIGDLDVTASREELSYDPVTVGILNKTLESVQYQIAQKFSDAISGAANRWDARLQFKKMRENKVLANLLTIVTNGHPITWNNKSVIEIVNIEYRGLFSNNKYENKELAPNIWKFKNHRLETVDSVNVEDSVIWIRKDVHNTSGRVRLLREKNPNQPIFVIEANDDDFAILQDHYGFDDYILASKLEQPAKKIMKFKGMSYIGGSGRKVDKWSTDTDLDTEMVAFYVTVRSFNPTKKVTNGENDKVEDVFIDHFDDCVDSAKRMGIIPQDIEIWGLNKTNTKLVEYDTNWTEFWTYLQEKVSDFVKNLSSDDYANNNAFRYSTVCSLYPDKFYQIFGNMNNDVGKFAKIWLDSQNNNSNKDIKRYELTNLCHYLGIDIELVPPEPENKVMESFKKMIETYPLMQTATNYYNYEVPVTAYKEYIIALDSLKTI